MKITELRIGWTYVYTDPEGNSTFTRVCDIDITESPARVQIDPGYWLSAHKGDVPELSWMEGVQNHDGQSPESGVTAEADALLDQWGGDLLHALKCARIVKSFVSGEMDVEFWEEVIKDLFERRTSFGYPADTGMLNG